ncbi:TPA: phage tail tape measure protein [Escherichia coli]|uniref:phage tail tape measure protein n=1 Tax=Escherichia coli TaxID=562 RepID=UPI000B429225|nr:phage tail tape measure protein [Escherichia coli]EIH5432973.1 phage tail tape measure protein [Escherichia coli]OWC18412.1 phage tail tape measure protein [Escherichia coli]RCR21197.1 phage tail tape measure protein [Escherichia coli]HAH2716936.1 phage tail tape measure protein [Escherichia coli]HAI0865159.1 phage tail tape measure protein [Escherichia coli]
MSNNLQIRVALTAVDRLTQPVRRAREMTGALSESLSSTQNALKSLQRSSDAFSRARQQVASTENSLNEARGRLQRLLEVQRTGTTLTEKQQEAIRSLTAKIERLNTVYALHQSRLREAGRELESHGIRADGSNRTTEEAIRRTQEYNDQLERQQAQLARVTQAQQRYDRVQDIAGKLSQRGALAMAAGSAGLYAAGRAVAPVVEEQRQGALIAAQSGGSAEDGQRYSRMIQNIRASGAATDIAMISEAAAAAQSTLGALGTVGTEELERVTRQAIDLAQVTGGNVAEQVQAAGIMLKNGLAANAGEAVDLMAAGMQKMSAEMRGELPEILHEYSTHFRNMGLSGSETMTLLVSMAQQGKFALDKTGDAVKEFSIRGSDMSKASVEAYGLIGLNAEKMSSAIASGGAAAREAMQRTAAGLLKIQDPAERANAAIALFGTPIEDLAVDQIPDFLRSLATVSDRMGQVQGTARRMGDVLRDNLGGDADRLSGVFSGIRSDVVALVTDDLRELVQVAVSWGERLRGWVQDNPQLVRTLAIVAGGVLAATTALGALSLTSGVLTGIFAKLQLGSALLGGGFSSVATGVGGLALRLSGLPALWGMVSGAVSVLGGALAGLLSPVGLVVAALAGGALLIWRHWEQVKAFMLGTFRALWAGLAPVREGVAQFAPLFDLVSGAVSTVYDWFRRLLTPVQTSHESLERCASAGETFGRVLSGAISLALTPLQALMDGLAWVLEKLGVLPSEVERAKNRAEAVAKAPVMWEWDPVQKKMVQKSWVPTPAAPVSNNNNGNGNPQNDGKTSNPPGITSGNSAVLRRLKGIEGNTSGMLHEARKRIGPGDIVFKNLPRALAVRGQWNEPTVAPGLPVMPPVSPVPPEVSRDASRSVEVKQWAPVSPATREASRSPEPSSVFGGEIHVHLHNVATQNPRDLARMVGEAVREEIRRQSAGMNSFRDRD